MICWATPPEQESISKLLDRIVAATKPALFFATQGDLDRSRMFVELALALRPDCFVRVSEVIPADFFYFIEMDWMATLPKGFTKGALDPWEARK